jgi:uncharacterized membrane protein YeaQ/YmgE (transglycosylase-associated protein family)
MVYAVWIFLLYLFLVGLAAGWIGWVVMGSSKALRREDRKPNWTMLLLLGLIGSFVGGLAVSLLAGEGLDLRPSGMIASALGAIAVVAVYLAVKRR